MADNLRNKTINGVLWSGIDRFSTQGITFIFNILIARILLPEDYGVVAMLNVFIAVAQVFIDSGFGHALIRKQNRTEDDYSTVFFFNLLVSTLFFLLLWFTAPLIASFYETPVLTKVTRIISSTLIINALGAVQNVQLLVDINFKTKAIISVIRSLVMGAVGLVMAVMGYGIWALVVQNVAGSVALTISLFAFVRWIPKLRFSIASFKDMFSFGSKLLLTNLIDKIWGNLYTIVIGKVFSPSSLGLYNRAESFATFPSANIYGMIQSVIYPSLCTIQDDLERLRSGYRQFIKLSSYIVFPLMFGLAAVSDPFTRLVLTDNWAGMIPILQVICFSLVLYPLNAININFPTILGRSDMFLKYVIANKIVEFIVLIATIPFGLMAMCIGKVISALILFYVNTLSTKKLIGYGIVSQLKDIFAILLHSAIMAVIVLVAIRFVDGNALRLGVGILIGALYYLGASVLFKIEEFYTLKDIVLSKILKKA